MSSSGTEGKQWATKYNMSEKELMQNVIRNLLEILCSSFEYITQEHVKALRSARDQYVDREMNMEALLTEISVVKEDCMEKMDRVKQAEDNLVKTIDDIQKELEHWPSFAKGNIKPVCDEKQKLLNSIADQRHYVHSNNEVDDASTRILLFLDYERQMLTKYFTYTKNDAKSNDLGYSTFAAKTTVLDSIGADHPLHLHDEEQAKNLTDKTRGLHEYEECSEYLCPFRNQPHFHECKLSDCQRTHVYTCTNKECPEPHCHPTINESRICPTPCEDKQCDKYPTLLKFGNSLCFQQKPNNAKKVDEI